MEGFCNGAPRDCAAGIVREDVVVCNSDADDGAEREGELEVAVVDRDDLERDDDDAGEVEAEVVLSLALMLLAVADEEEVAAPCCPLFPLCPLCPLCPFCLRLLRFPTVKDGSVSQTTSSFYLMRVQEFRVDQQLAK